MYYIYIFKINNFILEAVRDYPNLASSYVAGKTYEGRDLRVLVLGTKTSQRKIWIDCGIHAVSETKKCILYNKIFKK